jgi:hypothetical protein
VEAWRLALEARVLDGRANGGRRERSLVGLHALPAYKHRKPEEMAGGTFKRGGISASFFYMAVSPQSPLIPAHALVVTRDLDEKSRDGRSGNELWT